MIKEWLETYSPKNQEELTGAMREIMQEITLVGMKQSGFFEKAAFYGGTALRIFHKLDRFSEDLDFSLLEKDDSFSLAPYLGRVISEFESMGIQVQIEQKKKTIQTNVDSEFLKSETIMADLSLSEIIPSINGVQKLNIKIKIEIDTAPPSGFSTEEKLLLKPFSFYVPCYQLPDLFAGKMHALLFRKWKQRIKGRDWYDMEWYIKNGIKLHKTHFLERAKDSGDWHAENINDSAFLKLVQEKIEQTSIDAIKEDVVRFIPDASKIDIWSKQYFLDLTQHLKFC